MTWVNLILALLKLSDVIMTYVRERQLMDAGEDKAIAGVTQSILSKTEAGRIIMARVETMSDDEVDAALHDLEDK